MERILQCGLPTIRRHIEVGQAPADEPPGVHQLDGLAKNLDASRVAKAECVQDPSIAGSSCRHEGPAQAGLDLVARSGIAADFRLAGMPIRPRRGWPPA